MVYSRSMPALLLLLAAAASPEPAPFLARFAPAQAPVVVAFEGGVRLAPAEAIEQVLAPAARLPAEGPAAGLRGRWATRERQQRTRALLEGTADPGESLGLWAQWRLTLPAPGTGPLELLAVAVREEFPAGSQAEVWLLALRGGKLLDAALLAARGESEAGTVADEVTVGGDGRFRGTRRQVVPLHDVPGVEQLEVRSTRGGAAEARRGRFTLDAEDFEQRGGRYVDRRSGEVLLVVDRPDRAARVLYQARATSPRQELAVEEKAGALTVRFARSPKAYRLLFDDHQAALACENPDGTVQRFTREW